MVLARVETTFRIPLNPALHRREKVELLAPAGSFEALVAAVENGADAIYLGGNAFNARKFAANFTDEELAAACDYAHVRGVKIFLTFNILIFNHEFEEAVRFLGKAREMGVDALIIQDLGIMKAVRDLCPDFPIHISTQATVHNTEGIRFLEDLGAERVILARENSLKEIKRMRESTNAELEHFSHGAMCYCYSGQCLMSSVIGERSGNRGACAYTCRLPFTMQAAEADGTAPPPPVPARPTQRQATWENPDVQDPYQTLPHVREKHVLSSKDMNDLDHVAKMIEAGVMSFKIEGRMKRPEYVAVVTRAYRNAIDRYYAGKFHVTDEEKDAVLKVFNRDFTKAWVDGKDKWNYTTWDTAGNKGIPLGEVVDAGPGWVRIKLADTLRVKDGIEIIHTPDHYDGARGGAPEEYGFTVNQILGPGDRYLTEAHKGQTVTVKGRAWCAPGDPVYKTADFETLEKARKSYETPHRKVAVSLHATVQTGEKLRLHLKEPTRGFEVDYVHDYVVPPAKRAPLVYGHVAEQLRKVGDTHWLIEDLQIDLAPDAFAPISVLNEARRAGLAALEHTIAEHYHRAPIPGYAEKARKFVQFPTVDRSTTRPSLAVNCWTLENLHAALRGGAKTVYFSGLKVGGLQPKYDVEAVAEALRLCEEHGADLWLASGMIQKDYEVDQFRATLERFPTLNVLAGNHGAFQVARQLGRRVVGDWMLNVYNSVTVDYLRAHGAERLTLSPELTLDQMADIAKHTPERVEAIVHGRLTLMTSEYCSIGHAEACQLDGGTWAPCHDKKYRLQDRLGKHFPLETDGACRMYILNSVELNMINKLPQLAAAGLDVLRIETIGSRPDAVEAQTRVYLEALEAYNKDPTDYIYKMSWWDQLKEACPDGFTSGHFFRGPH
ncbi:MAG TPA: DUF3656 domain-containing protein [Candidatus Thermoplasmatota archaeon]|nr:DUF3656 domain-containing protein [Candidatus Thermoplasmatota archaeon]